MPRDPRFDVLFEPIKIGPKELKNRFYLTGHANGFGIHQPAASAAYRGMRAEGGWGVVNTEYCSVHPEYDDTPQRVSTLWDEDDTRALAVMVDAVHEHGALAGVQLADSGGTSDNFVSRLPSRAVSQIALRPGLPAGYAMSKDEIRELQGFYLEGARRAMRAGFDIINVGGSEGETLGVRFLTGAANTRTDEYGGSSLENRARFWLEMLEMVRAEVADQCAISIRLCLDSLRTPGVRIDDVLGFVALADDLVDLWDLQVGGFLNGDPGPARFWEQNGQRPWVEQVRPYTKKPIVGVGRFTDPDIMVAAIASGQLDIIGAARPGIADPFLPRKIEEGRLDDIRECIGCNACVARFEDGSQIVCTQNATTGEEFRRGWHPERFTRASNVDEGVVVIGAGPAGLECARVLAERGFRELHVVDRASRIGGHLRWAGELPGMGTWQRVLDYRASQLKRLRVELHTNTDLTAADVLEYGASRVVVATGSHWAADGLNPVTWAPIEGADASQDWVLTPEQLMVERKAIPGEEVVIFDCDGHYLGVSLAERLAREGRRVTLVTPFATAAPRMQLTGEHASMIARLGELDVRVLAEQAVARIARDHVLVGPAGDAAAAGELRADAVVLVTQRVSDDAIYRSLIADPRLAAEGIAGVYRIGDCLVPRIVAESVFDGHRLGREIDAADPGTPLPFVRERTELRARVVA